MSAWWQGMDPDDPSMFAYGSDVEWVRGSYAARLEHPVVFQRINPWLPGDVLSAWAMAERERDAVVALMGTLISWRVCTVRQLQAGLCPARLPVFDRYSPNLYGALCRLGIINVGFSPAERLEGRIVPHVWLSMSNDAKLIRRGIRRLGADSWTARTLTPGSLTAQHTHARHNTYAAHVGLTAMHDPRVSLTGGDGWAGFRDVDRQAAVEADTRLSSADVVILTKGNVLAGVEVQSSPHGVYEKASRWARLLAYSPMRRRGLVCVWLTIPNGNGAYSDLAAILGQLASQDTMMVGDPPVAARMGCARWDQWYAQGKPTGRFGGYVDMLGETRSIFDDAWSAHTPTPAGIDHVRDWGWRRMRDDIRANWGWDASRWTFPESLRGGFAGFAQGGAE